MYLWAVYQGFTNMNIINQAKYDTLDLKMFATCRTDQLVEVYTVRWRLAVFPERCWSPRRSLGRGWRTRRSVSGCRMENPRGQNDMTTRYGLNLEHIANVAELTSETDCSRRLCSIWTSFSRNHTRDFKLHKDGRDLTKAVSPQQFALPEDWVVDRIEGLQADVQILNPHVGQLLGVGLLDSCNHRLGADAQPVNLARFSGPNAHGMRASARAHIPASCSPCPSSSGPRAARCPAPRCSWAKGGPTLPRWSAAPLASPSEACKEQMVVGKGSMARNGMGRWSEMERIDMHPGRGRKTTKN